MFVLQMVGVYPQGIGGVFDSRDKAVEAAETLHAVGDGYHVWEILEVPLNTVVEPQGNLGTHNDEWPLDPPNISDRAVTVFDEESR